MRSLKNEICFCLNDPTWRGSSYVSEKYELTLKKPNLTPNALLDAQCANPIMLLSLQDKSTTPASNALIHLSGHIFLIPASPPMIDFEFSPEHSDWLSTNSTQPGTEKKDQHKNIIELLEQLFAFMEPHRFMGSINSFGVEHLSNVGASEL